LGIKVIPQVDVVWNFERKKNKNCLFKIAMLPKKTVFGPLGINNYVVLLQESYFKSLGSKHILL